MSSVASGLLEGIPYSLSRWTDLPACRWDWMLEALHMQRMVAFDPHTAVPRVWSLSPKDTLALVFWTRNPSNLIRYSDTLKPYRVRVHMTVTGWEEVEHGAPTLVEGVELLTTLVAVYGPSKVTWRFSPIPAAMDVVDRFRRICEAASKAGLGHVYTSFLQENDLLPETRSHEEKLSVLRSLAEVAKPFGVQVRSCADDRSLFTDGKTPHSNCVPGVCVPPEGFRRRNVTCESCGCVAMADPFTLNEACKYGCAYCYAADKSLSPERRDTVHHLPVLQ
jgi:hypothetical protein